MKVFCWLLLALSWEAVVGQNKVPSKVYEQRREEILEQLLQKDILVDPSLIFFDIYGFPVGVPYQYIEGKSFIPPFPKVEIGAFELVEPAYYSFVRLQKKALGKGFSLSIKSANRTWETQEKILKKYGERRAERPGYSEHHLFTTIDLEGVTRDSKLFKWLLRNAFEEGWVPSYFFRAVDGFQLEPWHWRYIGVISARYYQKAWKKEILRELER